MTDAVTAAAVDDECLGPGATVRVRSSIRGNPFGWPWTRTPRCSAPAAAAGRRGRLAPKPGESPGASTRSTLARVRRWSLDRLCAELRRFSTLERESNPRQTVYQTVALPSELSDSWWVTRDSNPASFEAASSGPHPLLSAMRHVRHRRTHPDAAHRRGGLSPEPLACEHSSLTADSCATGRVARPRFLGLVRPGGIEPPASTFGRSCSSR